MNRVKILALDFDGVITNLDINWESAIRLASKTAGYDVKSLITFYETSHDSSTFQKVSREIEELELDALTSAKLVPFIKEFFEEISRVSVETYAVSMQSAPAVKKFLRLHHLEGYFKEVLTRERFASKKTQIEYILKKRAVNPSDVLLIDDSQRNIDNCKELGIRCFHFIRRQDAARTKQMWNSALDIVQGRIH